MTEKEIKQMQAEIERLRADNARTLQRRIMDVTGMTPADYRALFTRDM